MAIMVELTEMKFVLWFVVPAVLFMIVGYILRMIDERRNAQVGCKER